jgi:hypothetical protein
MKPPSMMQTLLQDPATQRFELPQAVPFATLE